MKNFYKNLALTLFFSLLITQIWAQSPLKFSDFFYLNKNRFNIVRNHSGIRANDYSFSRREGTYKDLTGSISLNNNTVWDTSTFNVPLEFDFDFFDERINSVYIEDGVIGNVAFTIDPIDFSLNGYQYLFSGNSADMADRGYDSGISQSPISYLTEGIPGNRILKIEWKNAGFYNEYLALESFNDFVNFQIWLYEINGDIEVHYGPSNISHDMLNYGDLGPGIGLIKVNFQDTTANILVYSLLGDPSDPIFIESEDGSYLDGTPSDGTIYRFSRNTITGTEIQNHSVNTTNVFPNPFRNQIVIESKSFLNNAEISLINSTGQLVKKINGISGNFHILDRENLPNGIYMLALKDANKVLFTGRIVVTD